MGSSAISPQLTTTTPISSFTVGTTPEGEVTFDSLKVRYESIVSSLRSTYGRYSSFATLADDFEAVVEKIFPRTVTDVDLQKSPVLKERIFNKLNNLFTTLEELISKFNSSIKNQEFMVMPKFSIIVDFILDTYYKEDSVYPTLENNAPSLVTAIEQSIDEFISKLLANYPDLEELDEDKFIQLLNEKESDLDRVLSESIRRFQDIINLELRSKKDDVDRFSQSMSKLGGEDEYQVTSVLNSNLNLIDSIISISELNTNNVNNKDRLLGLIVSLRGALGQNSRALYKFKDNLTELVELIPSIRDVLSHENNIKLTDYLDIVQLGFESYYQNKYQSRFDLINQYNDQITEEVITQNLLGKENWRKLKDIQGKINAVNTNTNFDDVDKHIDEYINILKSFQKLLQEKILTNTQKSQKYCESILNASFEKDKTIFHVFFQKARSVLVRRSANASCDKATLIIGDIKNLLGHLSTSGTDKTTLPNTGETPLLTDGGLGEIRFNVEDILTGVKKYTESRQRDTPIDEDYARDLFASIDRLESLVNTYNNKGHSTLPEEIANSFSLLTLWKESTQTDLYIQKLQKEKYEIMVKLLSREAQDTEELVSRLTVINTQLAIIQQAD